MEHSPLNMEALANFVAAMNDKAYTVKNGARPRSALVVRMPPYASGRRRLGVKQSLDIGVMGFVFNTVETRERRRPQCRACVTRRGRRFPTRTRGRWASAAGRRAERSGPGASTGRYRRRADVWPLNPEGDLMAIMIIETEKGVKNADAIAQVPGVTALSAAAGAICRRRSACPRARRRWKGPVSRFCRRA